MNRQSAWWIVCCGLFGSLVVVWIGWTEERHLSDAEITVRTTEDGHRLLLPKDWPIERKNGVIAPVGVEQYLSVKFNQVEQAFQSIDARLNQLEARVTTLEQDQQSTQQRLRALEEFVRNSQDKR